MTPLEQESTGAPASPATPAGTLFSQTTIYGLGAALRHGLAFLLIPVYTRYLTPADYGVLELVNIFALVVVTIGAQGIGTAFCRFYPTCANDAERRSLYGTACLWVAASALLVSAAAFFASGTLASVLLGAGSRGEGPLRIVLVYACLQIAAVVPLQLFRVRLLAGRFVAVMLAGFATQLGTALLLVCGLGLGVPGVLWGQAAGAFVVLAGALVAARREVALRLSRALLAKLLAFGLPLIIAGLAWLVLDVSDRILLGKLTTTHDLGLYSLGAKLANALRVALIVPFSTAWGAICFRIAEEPAAKQRFSRIATSLLLVLCTAGMLICVWIPVAIRPIAGREFWGAQRVVLPLVAAAVLGGMFQFFNLGVVLANRTKHMAWVVAGGGAANIGLNLALIPPLGILGAALASVAAYAAITAATYRLGQRLWPIPFELGKLVRIGAVFAVTSLAGTLVDLEVGWTDLLWRATLTAAFGALVLRAGVLAPGTLAGLGRSVAGRLRPTG